jgi:hypothetical protein
MDIPGHVSTDPLLRRKELAAALTAAGYPTAEQTLARKAVEGSGPPFRIWGRFPIYQWSAALHWAEICAGRPRTSTSDDGGSPRARRVQQRLKSAAEEPVEGCRSYNSGLSGIEDVR